MKRKIYLVFGMIALGILWLSLISPVYPAPRSSKKIITIASWNIRILSDSRPQEGLQKMAKLILPYDLISILEVRDAEVVQRLLQALQKLGRHYECLLSQPVGRQQKEIYCFLYDPRKVSVLQPGKIVTDVENNFIREPFYATFQSGAFDFTIIAVHIVWGKSVKERRQEIVRLATIFQQIQDADAKENDIILMGDFNRPPEDDLAFGAMKAIPNMIWMFSAPEKSMIGDTNLYDNIWFQQNYVKEFAKQKGIVRFDESDFAGDLATAEKLVSDHRPIWASFQTSGPDDD